MKTNKLYYGAAYYDEYMPYDRIEKDFTMMEEAGMNVIRIAESTWSTWEPQEGTFDFSHLRRMLDCAKEHNLSVIIGTPTYAIPSWLAKKEKDILAFTHDGQEIYGHRQNMDITNPTYLKHAKIIIEKLMEQVKDEPNVIGFQLDNETKHYDTCSPRAQKMFVDYLKEKWPDILEFNHEFGLDYWSNRVDNWDDFPDIRGTINQSLAAEYSKFQRKLVTDFLAWQADIVSKYKRPDQFISQNFDFEWRDYSFGLQPEVNQFEASRCMDVAGCDIYHPSQDNLTGCEITACGNIARGLMRDNYLVLETEAQGNQAWLPYPGQLRLQAYSHIANGANSVMYWHWHSIHNAIESYWKGVLSHDLSENETYRECKVIGNEWKRIGHKIKNLQKKNKIAIVLDNESLTALTNFPTETNGKHSYNNIFRFLSDALYKLGYEYDVIPARADLLTEYEYVCIPALYSAKEDFLHAINSYVENGGNLITTFKSAFSDEHIKIYADTQPHIIHKVLGIHYDQFTYPKDVRVSYHGVTSDAKEWMELLQLDSAKSLANYEHHTWKKYPAITLNQYKKGRAMYFGTLFGEETCMEVLKEFITLPASNSKYPLVVKEGINDDENRVIFVLNYSKDSVTYTCDFAYATEIISNQSYANHDVLTLSPWGVAIFECNEI